MDDSPENALILDLLGPKNEANFCDQCRMLVSATRYPPDDHRYPTHQPRFSDLEKAAQAGCIICKRIMIGIWGGVDAMPARYRVMNERCTWYTWTEKTLFGGVEYVSIFLDRATYVVNTRKSCVLVIAFDPLNDKTYLPALIRSNHLASDKTWEQATAWVSNCLANHPHCSNRNSESWYPTRLLDVGTRQVPKVKLCITADSKMEGPYVTLSHRWGEGEMVKLLTTNIARYVQEIQVQDLPQTFADAIEVARRLQVRYIWIDSLCIIQDSDADWQAEAVQMQAVYRHSFLNISATGSGDSSGTGALFRKRDPDAGWVAWTAGRSKGQRLLMYDSDFWKNELLGSELNHRAWVLQERMLAHRVLHFGENQLFWECQEMEACESFPGGIPLKMRDDMGKAMDPDRFEERKRTLDLGERAKWDTPEAKAVGLAHELWINIVTMYSSCNLTKEKDKLIAMSGIAKHFSTMINDEYLAGTWRSNLVEGLSWMSWVPERENGLSPPTSYRAPSWSWASSSCTIRHFHLDVNQVALPQVTIEEASVTPRLGDHFGEIQDGYIKLTGALIGPFRIGTSSSGRNYWDLKDVHLHASNLNYVNLHMDHPRDFDEAGLFFLPLQNYYWGGCTPEKPDYKSWNILCLILRKLPSKGPNTYERCGAFELSDMGRYVAKADHNHGISVRQHQGWTRTEAKIVLV